MFVLLLFDFISAVFTGFYPVPDLWFNPFTTNHTSTELWFPPFLSGVAATVVSLPNLPLSNSVPSKGHFHGPILVLLANHLSSSGSAASVARALSTPRRQSTSLRRALRDSASAMGDALIDLESSVDISLADRKTISKLTLPPLTTTITPSLSTVREEVKSLIESVGGIQRGYASKSSIKFWLTKLRSIESFLLATVDEPATQSPSTQAHIDYEQLCFDL